MDATNPVQFEGTLDTREDEQLPIEINSTDISFHEDRVILSVVRDIRQRVKAEYRLRRMRRAIEATGHAVYITDPNGTIQYVNPAFEEIAGYSADEAIGKNPRILKSGEMADGYYEELWNTVLAGDVWEERIINQRKDGELYHAQQTIAPILDDGAVEGFVAIQTDITEQVEQERHLETLINNLPGMVYRCRNEPGWPMSIVRGEVRELVGYSAEEFESGAVSWGQDVIYPDERDRVRTAVQEAVRKDEPFELVYRVRTEADTERWVWEQGRQVDDTDGTAILEGFIMDITERQHLQADLEEIIRQLRVIDRVLRHNLRNDMNVIKGYAETIQAASEGETAAQAATIVQESEQLLTTVDKEREITMVLSEQHLIEPVNLGGVVDRTVAEMEAAHPPVEITVERPAEISVSAIEPIDRAIAELLENAIIHCDRDQPTIDVAIDQENGAVEVRIADNGPGIPKVERQILKGEADIDPLFHGSGLGLWLVYLIVKESGGTLSFDENEPRGSIVTIRLPAATAGGAG